MFSLLYLGMWYVLPKIYIGGSAKLNTVVSELESMEEDFSEIERVIRI